MAKTDKDVAGAEKTWGVRSPAGLELGAGMLLCKRLSWREDAGSIHVPTQVQSRRSDYYVVMGKAERPGDDAMGLWERITIGSIIMAQTFGSGTPIQVIKEEYLGVHYSSEVKAIVLRGSDEHEWLTKNYRVSKGEE